MGGRGASFGISDKGKKYGSQYHTIFAIGNVKFISKNARDSEPIMETMTRGRVYVTVGGTDLLQIVYFDTQNKRNKTVDLSHSHDGIRPHVHHGYEHNENDGPKGATNLTPKEKIMVARVKKLWYDYLNK